MDLDGEQLDVRERVITSPATGVFVPVERDARPLRAGDTVGHVLCPDGLVPVPSPFAGNLVEVVAVSGERVRCHERVAWLRVEG